MTKIERMKKDLSFFIECVHGRKIDPAMIKHSIMPIEAPRNWSGEEEKTAKANDAYWRNALGAQINPRSLGNCEAATPCTDYLKKEYLDLQEKGNNPMRIDNTTATAYVAAPKSDDAVSRDYLLGRLSYFETWHNSKLRELNEFFNLGEDGRPKSYLQLIDAIKNGKYTLDDNATTCLKLLKDDLGLEDDDLSGAAEEYGYGPFYGIVFTDFPKADRKGYDAAVKEFEALRQATKDTIMVKSPDEGLSALQALEAWMPVGKAN